MIGLDTRKSPTTTVHLARAYEKPGENPRFEVLESPIPPREPLDLRQVPHPESPIAKAAPLTDPAITAPLLVDYLAGYTASRLCASYNITLPQLFAWHRLPETQDLLREHAAFADAQARDVQHDKESEIILTLCAIATRGTSEAECRRAASDLLRAFKFREYLAQRKPRNSDSSSGPQPDPQSLPDPDPRLPDPFANPRAFSIKPVSDPKRSSNSPAPVAPSAGFANLDSIASLNDAANLATEILHDDEDSDEIADNESSERDDRADASANQSEADAADDESDLDEEVDSEEDADAENADDFEDETDGDDDDDDPDAPQDGQPAAHEEDEDDDDEDDADEERDDAPENQVGNNTTPDSFAPRALKHNTPEDNTRKHNTSRATPHSLCEVILNVPEVPPAYSPTPPDPPPGHPFCLNPKFRILPPCFSEMKLFMPLPAANFNPYWPESDIFYLCFPGRTDKHHLRQAIVSHQEALARSGAQVLVDRRHFYPEQQSHEAYTEAVNFYQELARRHPPPDH